MEVSMRKLFCVCFVLLLATALTLPVVCGNAYAEKPVEIMVAYGNQPGEPVDKAVTYWAKLLKEKSGGAIILKQFPSSQLGDEATVQQQAKMGANIITIASYGSLADLVPDIGVINAPYVGTSVEQKVELVHSKQFTELISQLDGKGLHAIITDFYYGTRQLMSKTKATSPAGMKGKKIRVQNAKIANYWALSVGATPTPMALSEAYTAMSQGIVSGIENPPGTLYGGKFYEQAKYLILTNHDVHMTPWIVGTAFWKKLSADQQKLITATGLEMSKYASELIKATEQDYIDKMVAEGVEVVKVDVAPYLENALNVMAGQFPEWTDGLYEKTLNSLK
jgi:tripartite ATP-independent transporter DctP family solute receptor